MMETLEKKFPDIFLGTTNPLTITNMFLFTKKKKKRSDTLYYFADLLLKVYETTKL